MRKIFITNLLLLFTLIVQSQVDLKQVVPPNPNVASLMKATLTPVTEYAGLPNVSIPIYTVTEDNVSVPISLSYHTGGIQVGEESGSVGLGWALNSGGAITRSVNGGGDFNEGGGSSNYLSAYNAPDLILTQFDDGNDHYNPIMNRFLKSDNSCNFLVNGTPTYYTPIDHGNDGFIDYMPDIFHFNFNGHSGSFVLRKDGSVSLMEKSGIHVDIIYIERGLGFFDPAFIVTAEDGTEYRFESWEKTDTNIDQQLNLRHISTWYLSKIVTTNKKEIKFKYESLNSIFPYSTPHKIFTQKYYGYGDFENFVSPQSTTEDKYITEISYDLGMVRFNYSDYKEREDIQNSYFLKSIEVLPRDLSSTIDLPVYLEPVSEYVLHHSYFGFAPGNSNALSNGDYAEVLNVSPGNPSLNLRLRLDGITANDGSHEFEYFDAISSNLTPNKTSMSQDYWGFYNGIKNTETFIPFYNTSIIATSSKKALRHPVEAAAKLFSLKKIIYPTKGATEFDYELNTYNPDATNGIPPTTVKKWGRASTSGYPQAAVAIDTIHSTTGFPDLTISYNLFLRSSSFANNDPNHPFTLQDMRLKIRSLDGVYESVYDLPSEALYEFKTNGTPASDNRPNPIPSTLDSNYDTYIIEAYFNTYNDQYQGFAEIYAEWYEVEESKEEQLSVGGGLRIKSITDKDYSGVQLRKRNYNYHYKELDDDGVLVEKSYGKIKVLPYFNLDHPLMVAQFPGNMSPLASAEQLIASASSITTFSKGMGSYVGYDQVEVTFEDFEGKTNGKTISKFYNYKEIEEGDNNLNLSYLDEYYKPTPFKMPHNGRLYRQEHYKIFSDESNPYKLVSATENKYEINGFLSSDFGFYDLWKNDDFVVSAIHERIFTGESNNHCEVQMFQFYPYYSNLIQQVSQIQTVYDTNGENPLTTEQNFFYEDNPVHYQVIKTEVKDSKGNYTITKTRFPNDFASSTTLNDNSNSTIEGGALNDYTEIEKLKSKDVDFTNLHRISEPIQVETYQLESGSEKLVSLQRTNYKDWDSILGIDENSNRIYPDFVQTLKGEYSATENILKERIQFHEYDVFGNSLEVSKKDGMHISYVWGYNNKYPIAKIGNMAYNDIPIALIGLIKSASNADKDHTVDTVINGTINYVGNEGLLREALNNLRTSLPNAMITTYTYDPLIGVTSVTDPRGRTLYYEYDTFNRLKVIRDQEGNIVEDYDYQYKTNQ